MSFRRLITSYSNRYGTIYTMFPVFSLVLDEDVPSDIALIYPELYKDLAKVGKTIKLQSQLFVYDQILLRQFYFSSWYP